MRRHFSPPQLPFSSLPIPPSPPTLIPPPSLLPLIHLIFLVLQHLLTLLLGSSFIHPFHSPSFPFSPPSAPLLTLLFPVSPSFFSFSSSSCSPLSSTFVFSFFPFSSSLHHPALSIYGPVIPSSSSSPLSWFSSSTFSSFSYFSPSPHSLPPPLIPSAPLPLTSTVPQLQQAKSAARNLKRYVL